MPEHGILHTLLLIALMREWVEERGGGNWFCTKYVRKPGKPSSF